MSKRAKVGSDETVPRTILDAHTPEQRELPREPLGATLANLTEIDKDADLMWTAEHSADDALVYLADLREVADLAMDNTTDARMGARPGAVESVFPAPYMFETRRIRHGYTNTLANIAAIATGNDLVSPNNRLGSGPGTTIVGRLRRYTRMRIAHPQLFASVLSESQSAQLASIERKWHTAATDYRRDSTPTAAAQTFQVALIDQSIANARGILKQIDAERAETASAKGELDTWRSIVRGEIDALERDRTQWAGAETATVPTMSRVLSAVAGLPMIRQAVAAISVRAEPIQTVDQNHLRALSMWGYIGLSWPEAMEQWDRGLVGSGPVSDPVIDLALYSELLVRVYESTFVRAFNTLADVCYARVVKRPFDRAMAAPGDTDSPSPFDKQVVAAIRTLQPILMKAATPEREAGRVVVEGDAQSRLRTLGGGSVDPLAQISFDETMFMGCIGDMTGMATHRSGMAEDQEPRSATYASEKQLVVGSYVHRDRTLSRATRGGPWDRLNQESPAYCSKIDPRESRVLVAFYAFAGAGGEQHRATDEGGISQSTFDAMRQVQSRLFESAPGTDPVHPTYTARMIVANVSKWLTELEQHCIRRATHVFVLDETQKAKPAVDGKPIDAASLMQELQQTDALRKYIRRAHRIIHMGLVLGAQHGARQSGLPKPVSAFIDAATTAREALMDTLEKTSEAVYKVLKESPSVKGDLAGILRDEIKIDRPTNRAYIRRAKEAITVIRGLEHKWLSAYDYCVAKSTESANALGEKVEAARHAHKVSTSLEDSALEEHARARMNKDSAATIEALRLKAVAALETKTKTASALSEAKRQYKSGLNGDVRLCAAMARAATMWGIEPYLVAPVSADGKRIEQAAVEAIESSGLVLRQDDTRVIRHTIDGVKYMYVPYSACEIADPIEFIINSVLVPSQTILGVRYTLAPDENTTRAYMESFRAKWNILREATALRLPEVRRQDAENFAVGVSIMASASVLFAATGLVSSTATDSLPTDSSLASYAIRTCAIAILRLAGAPVENLGQIDRLDAASAISVPFFGKSVARLYARTNDALLLRAVTGGDDGSLIRPVFTGVTLPIVAVPLVINSMRIAARSGWSLPVAVTRNGVVCALFGVHPVPEGQPASVRPLVLHTVGITLGALGAMAAGGADWFILSSVTLGAALALQAWSLVQAKGGLGNPEDPDLEQQVDNAILVAQAGGAGAAPAVDPATRTWLAQLLSNLPDAKVIAEWLAGGAVEIYKFAKKYPVLAVAIVIVASLSAWSVAASTQAVIDAVVRLSAPPLWAARDVVRRCAVATVAQFMAGIAVRLSADLEKEDNASQAREYAIRAVVSGLATTSAFVAAAHVDHT